MSNTVQAVLACTAEPGLARARGRAPQTGPDRNTR